MGDEQTWWLPSILPLCFHAALYRECEYIMYIWYTLCIHYTHNIIQLPSEKKYVLSHQSFSFDLLSSLK